MGDVNMRAAVAAARSRLHDVTSGPWSIERGPDGEAVIRTAARMPNDMIRVTRDSSPASDEDVEFIVMARNVMDVLLSGVEGFELDHVAPEEELARIEAIAAKASSGPWKAFIESEGGIGGHNMIWAGGDQEPDIYLWARDDIARDGDYTFVAAARQDIPDLIAVLRDRQKLYERPAYAPRTRRIELDAYELEVAWQLDRRMTWHVGGEFGPHRIPEDVLRARMAFYQKLRLRHGIEGGMSLRTRGETAEDFSAWVEADIDA